MGIVVVRYSGTMDTMAVGRDALEKQNDEGCIKEEDMHVDEDYSIMHTRQQSRQIKIAV